MRSIQKKNIEAINHTKMPRFYGKTELIPSSFYSCGAITTLIRRWVAALSRTVTGVLLLTLALLVVVNAEQRSNSSILLAFAAIKTLVKIHWYSSLKLPISYYSAVFRPLNNKKKTDLRAAGKPHGCWSSTWQLGAEDERRNKEEGARFIWRVVREKI